jgi:DNA segregation ATPase FtsK/SpoIIIE, S-DNA-T family
VPQAPAERRKGGYVLPPVTLLDAPKEAAHKIDERELMEAARLLEEKCREFSVGHRRPDSPGPGRHHLRVQAGRRREVQPHHRPGRRPVPRDAGRVGADRPHPGKSTVGIQIPNRTASRSRCASCSSRTPTAVRVKLTLALGKTIHGEPFVATWRRCRTC